MSIITVIEGLAQRFGEWIKKAFGVAEEIYNELMVFEQEAAKTASFVVSTALKFASSPEAITFLKTFLPSVDVTVIQGILDTFLRDVNWVTHEVPLTAEEAISELRLYLKQFEGDALIQHTQGASNLIAKGLSASDTPIQKFITTSEYNYQINVKPVIDSSQEV